MDMTYVYYHKCPYCQKDVEIQLKPSQINVKLAKEEDSISGKYGYYSRQLRKELSRRKLVKKLLNLKKRIYEFNRDGKGVSYGKIQDLAEQIGITKTNDFDLILKNLEMNFDVCRLENGNFYIISM